MFYNTKDSISVEQKSNLFYRITCPCCYKKYVGKTDRNLSTRLNQAIYQHLSNWSTFNDHIKLFALLDAAIDTTIVSKESHLHNALIKNFKILDKNDKWGQLQFNEVYYIKKLTPEVNFYLKASEKVKLFE